MDRSITKCHAGMKSLPYHGIISFVEATNKTADSKYEDMQIKKFNIALPASQYINWNRFHICFLIKN